jgi:hypothetical protein
VREAESGPFQPRRSTTFESAFRGYSSRASRELARQFLTQADIFKDGKLMGGSDVKAY